MPHSHPTLIRKNLRWAIQGPPAFAAQRIAAILDDEHPDDPTDGGDTGERELPPDAGSPADDRVIGRAEPAADEPADPGPVDDIESRFASIEVGPQPPDVDHVGARLGDLDESIATIHSRLSAIDSRRRWPRFLAELAAVVVVVLAAFAIGRITAPDETNDQSTAIGSPAPVATTTTTTTTTRIVPPVTTSAPTLPPSTTSVPPTTTLPPATTAPAPALQLVTEIAAAVGPAVVQIEAGGALGSGVIYHASGFILTAAHVIDTAGDLVGVRLADGRLVDGQVIGAHTPTDIAVIKIKPVEGMQIAELAPPDTLRIGDLAVALGSPFGLEQTVTAGIVSAIDRIVDNVIMVQTDAAINPGNSGGPLVDVLGRVIGINDQIFTLGGGNEGVGFAISVELAALVAQQLVDGEPVQLAFLGVQVSPVDSDPPGARVERVVPDSAAEGAGIQVGDLIVRADDRIVISSEALVARVIKKSLGDTLVIDIVRDGDSLTISVILGSTDT